VIFSGLTSCGLLLIPVWENCICYASQKIIRLVWNTNVHYRVHKSPTTVSILIRNRHSIPCFLRHILTLSHLRLYLSTLLFLSGLQNQILFVYFHQLLTKSFVALLRKTVWTHKHIQSLLSDGLSSEWKLIICVFTVRCLASYGAPKHYGLCGVSQKSRCPMLQVNILLLW
jgi:hypothetical protein